MHELNFPFSAYAKKMKMELSALENLKLPEPLHLKIDWTMLDNISTTNEWNKIQPFGELYRLKSNPAIYYFEIDESKAEEIFASFTNCKKNSSQIRRESGVKEKNFYNLCHVPKKFQKSPCLYAGSVKRDLYTRLKQHLGYAKSGRTGALHLKRVFGSLVPYPAIDFRAYIFNKSMSNLTEHIELVVQTTLNPILGLKAFKYNPLSSP